MRQTPEYILKSFQNSGKRHLIITGERGSGKSSRLEIIRRFLKADMPGIMSYAIPHECVMLRDFSSGRECKIGEYDGADGLTANAMRPVKAVFLSFAVPVVESLISSSSQWAFVDEIGYLETEVEEYKKSLRKLFDLKRVVAVVRKQDTCFINEILCRDDVFVVDLENRKSKVGCVIMASGMGKRFGGNKLLATFNGRAMIENILDITDSALFEKRVVVTRSKKIADLCGKHGVDCVLHTLSGRNDTVRLGMEKMMEMDACVFCPSDQPVLSGDSIKRQVLAFSGESNEIIRLKAGKIIGSPVLFGKTYFYELCKLPEGKGGGVVIKNYPDKVKCVEVDNEWELFDVDTREQLEMLESVSGIKR